MFPVLLVLLAAAQTTPTAIPFFLPDFHDLTIRLRETHSNPPQYSQLTTWYFKGPRQRHEESREEPHFALSQIYIGQCDHQVMYALDATNKTAVPFVAPAYRELNGRAFNAAPPPPGPEIVVTIHSVETGEHRSVGGYAAHHIKSTISVDSNEPAANKPVAAELDSWYLDLPGLNCRAENPRRFSELIQALLAASKIGGGSIVINKTGVEPTGLPIEEIYARTIDGKSFVNKTELLEVSEQPLDKSLFELPPGYKRGER